jgi:hypothetical protein
VLTDERLDLIENGIDLALRIARTLPDSLIARPGACLGIRTNSRGMTASSTAVRSRQRLAISPPGDTGATRAGSARIVL